MGNRADRYARLVSYAQEHAGERFRWGTTDCYTLARGALDAFYGASLLPAVFYTRQDVAERAARMFVDIPGALYELGARPRLLAFAQAGDLIVMPGKDEVGLPRFGVVADGAGHLLTSDLSAGVMVVDMKTVPPDSTVWRWQQ